MQNLSPICLFVYKRLEETKQTINALNKNYLAEESDLIIFSDGAKTIDEEIKVKSLRKYLKTIKGFKSIEIHESKINKGLAESIIDGVSKVIKLRGKVIVLEDDLVSTENFLVFMNEALNFYQFENKIQSINGFSLKTETLKDDIYFHSRTFSWGWATWSNRWHKEIFDKKLINEKINSNKNVLNDFKEACGHDMEKMLLDSLSNSNDSWYVRWAFNHFLNNNYAVFPKLSKINNIGFTENATHCTGINTYITEIDYEFNRSFYFINFVKIKSDVNKQISRNFKKSHKLLFRLKLIKTNTGRMQLYREIKSRLRKNH